MKLIIVNIVHEAITFFLVPLRALYCSLMKRLPWLVNISQAINFVCDWYLTCIAPMFLSPAFDWEQP